MSKEGCLLIRHKFSFGRRFGRRFSGWLDGRFGGIIGIRAIAIKEDWVDESL